MYLMSKRRRLAALVAVKGFTQEAFNALSDARVTNRFKALNTVELARWHRLKAIGLSYPEKCLMGVFPKAG